MNGNLLASTLGGTIVQEGEQKVLDVNLSVSVDHIVFSLFELAEQARELKATKRNILRLIGTLYDPLEFLAPIMVKYKFLFHSKLLKTTHCHYEEVRCESLLLKEAQVTLTGHKNFTMRERQLKTTTGF